MNQFLLQQGSSKELVLFPHIVELALKKNHSQNHSIYAGYFNIFEKLSTKLFDEFEAIATLQQKGSDAQKIKR